MNQLSINVDEEIRILEYQPVVFWAGTELGNLYAAIAEKWNLKETGRTVFIASGFYNLGRIHGIREERTRRKKKKAQAVNKQIRCLGAEFVRELSRATPEDYLQTKLMMLSSVKHTKVKNFLQAVFALAEERRPLLLEMK